jgi:hypothetical protein
MTKSPLIWVVAVLAIGLGITCFRLANAVPLLTIRVLFGYGFGCLAIVTGIALILDKHWAQYLVYGISARRGVVILGLLACAIFVQAFTTMAAAEDLPQGPAATPKRLAECESGISELISVIENHLKSFPASISDGNSYLTEKLRAVILPDCPRKLVVSRLSTSPFFVRYYLGSPKFYRPSICFILANEHILISVAYFSDDGSIPVDGRTAIIKKTEANFRNELE